MRGKIGNFLVRFFGWRATLIFGDAGVFDRWLWLRKNIDFNAKKTLDAGCGSGAFSLYIARKGNKVIGISFDKRNNELAHKRAKILKVNNIEFITADLRELQALKDKLGKFKQIICFETIEHIKGDKKLIHDFAELLEPGGKLLVTVPYKYYKRIPGEKLSKTEDGGHVRWGYTHKEMGKILEQNGLTVKYECYITGIISQYLIRLQRIISKSFHPIIGWIVLLPLRPFQLLDPLVMKFVNFPYLSIGVLAIKE